MALNANRERRKATLNVHSEGRKATLNARNKRREASRVPGLLRNYINFKGGPMTNEQFRSQLRSLIDPKTTTSVKAISSLFSIATQENLSLLVVLIDDELQTLNADGLTFAHCATDWHDPVPSGCSIYEIELSGFFFHLIDNGYNGIGFIIDGAFIGIEWKDLMLPGR